MLLRMPVSFSGISSSVDAKVQKLLVVAAREEK